MIKPARVMSMIFMLQVDESAVVEKVVRDSDMRKEGIRCLELGRKHLYQQILHGAIGNMNTHACNSKPKLMGRGRLRLL